VTSKFHAIDLAIIPAAILGLHLAIVHYYPIIYGGDTVIRLVNLPHILISYQLPMFQLLVHLTMRWFFGPTAIWALMGIIAGIGAAGLYQLTWLCTLDRRAAWLASIFYAVHPFTLYYSLVPYQEPLFLATLVLGFYFLFQPHSTLNLLRSSVFLGTASLTRYEGWIGAGVAVAFCIWRRRKEGEEWGWRSIPGPVAFFGWAPALWIVYNKGLSPAGTFILDTELRWERLYRPYFIAKSVLWWTESALVLLALIGFFALLADSRSRSNRAAHLTLLSFIFLYVAAMTVSGHGIGPDPNRYVTEREAFIPIAFMLVYSAAGASRLSAEIERWLAASGWMHRAVSALALLFLVSLSLHRGVSRVAASNSDPDLKTDYEVAQFLRLRQSRALVLARPLAKEQVDYFLMQAEKAGGAEGREKARHILRQVETTPFDYQRVLSAVGICYL
jgi:hypothetical protein